MINTDNAMARSPGGSASALGANGDISADSVFGLMAQLMLASGENVSTKMHNAVDAQKGDTDPVAGNNGAAGAQGSNTNQGQIAVMDAQKAITDNSTLVQAATQSMSAVHDGVSGIVRNFK